MGQAVDVTSFITASDASAQAFKTATLLKTLSVNALITGEQSVGKKTLAKYILSDAPVIDASAYDELLLALESTQEIIITNLENSPNILTTIETINQHEVRVIATSKNSFTNESIDELFSLTFDIPPLSQREDDVQPLIEKFVQDAAILFGIEEEFEFEDFTPDLSQNAKSLQRQVMVNYLLHDIKDTELMEIIEHYLKPKLGSNSDYRKFLYLYEVPLIHAGLDRFKSQLQLSDKLGLNRNTLRKKIADNQQYIKG